MQLFFIRKTGSQVGREVHLQDNMSKKEQDEHMNKIKKYVTVPTTKGKRKRGVDKNIDLESIARIECMAET